MDGPRAVLEEMRVILRRDCNNEVIVRRVGNRAPVNDDAELLQTLRMMTKDYEKAGRPIFPVLIDAGPDVPWQDVVRVMDLCRTSVTRYVEFTAPYLE